MLDNFSTELKISLRGGKNLLTWFSSSIELFFYFFMLESLLGAEFSFQFPEDLVSIGQIQVTEQLL